MDSVERYCEQNQVLDKVEAPVDESDNTDISKEVNNTSYKGYVKALWRTSREGFGSWVLPGTTISMRQ